MWPGLDTPVDKMSVPVYLTINVGSKEAVMVKVIKMTSKRQATLPARVCEELDLAPGSEILLERRKIDGHPAWLLRTPSTMDTPWYGALQRYAKGRSHDMESIRRSIAKETLRERS